MKVVRRITRILYLILIFLSMGIHQAMAQCAMCRATVENNVSNGDVGIAAKLNYGIMYLFAAPYLVIGIVAYMWYRKSKQNAQKLKTTGNFRR